MQEIMGKENDEMFSYLFLALSKAAWGQALVHAILGLHITTLLLAGNLSLAMNHVLN